MKFNVWESVRSLSVCIYTIRIYCPSTISFFSKNPGNSVVERLALKIQNITFSGLIEKLD